MTIILIIVIGLCIFDTIANYQSKKSYDAYVSCLKNQNQLLKAPPHKIIDGWIPCNYKLPNIETKVLISTNDGHVCVAERMKLQPMYFWDGANHECYRISGEVSAWMPLPEAYKGGDK